jgi:peptidoglycan/xylan/chitin deacetylase (PgdA/CDA1 family)
MDFVGRSGVRSRVARAGLIACLLAATLLGCRTVAQDPRPARAAPTKASTVSEADKFWRNAKEEVDKSVLELFAQHEAELRKGIKYHELLRGDPKKKQVALTFDDGPHPDFTPKLLDVLKRYGARATFFVVGEMAEKAPDLVRAETAAGHSVANHTYHHVNLTKIPWESVATEIKACGDVVQAITGTAPHLFRPPGGDYNRRVAEAAEALDYTMVLWTDNPGDYESPGRKAIVNKVLRNLSSGGIVLMHDGVQETVDVLPQILEYLKQKGYQCVTVDQMMGR